MKTKLCIYSQFNYLFRTTIGTLRRTMDIQVKNCYAVYYKMRDCYPKYSRGRIYNEKKYYNDYIVYFKCSFICC